MSEIEDLKATVRTLTGHLQEAIKRESSTHQSFLQAREVIQRLEAQNKELSSQPSRVALINKILQLESDLSTVSFRCTVYKNDKDILQKRIDEQQLDIQKSTELIGTYRLMLDADKESNMELRQELSSKINKIIHLKAVIGGLKHLLG